MATLPTCFGVLAKGGKATVSVLPIPEPKRAGEVLVRVSCTAVNRADTLQRRGQYPPPEGATHVMGLEAAGVVVSRAPGCVRAFSPGQRVMALLPGGGFSQYALVHEGSLMRVPDGWDDVKAACTPEVFLTAFQLLHRLARVAPGDSVLVHAGASGVGTAAIQLAKLAGCSRIVATASKDKLETLKKLGATHVFDRSAGAQAQGPSSPGASSGAGAWIDELLSPAGGGPVDILLDPVGASYAEMNLRALNNDARWVLFGLMGGAKMPAPASDAFLRTVLSKRISLLGTTLRSRTDEYKAQLVADFEATGKLDALAKGVISPIIDSRVFHSLDDVNDALDYLESNKSVGKVAVRVAREAWM